MRLNLFGKAIEVVRSQEKWQVFYLGSEGKKRTAEEIIIPSEIKETEIISYLEALCHEQATPKNSRITIINPSDTKHKF